MATDTGARVHVERTGVVAMDLPCAEAFPLFSAEGERRWVAGWVPDHHAAMVDVHVVPEGEAHSRASVKYRMTSLSSIADDFVRAFGEAFEDYLGDWAEAIQRHIVEGVSLRR